jgi:uncharacterized protein YecT (DUF1311 family)
MEHPQLLAISLVLMITIPTGDQKLARKREPCWDTAQTQAELNTCAGKDFRKSDEEMNRLYQALLKKHESKKVFVEKLREAQRAWLRYRDAHLNSWYPDVNKHYGTVQPICSGFILVRLTEERIRELKDMLTPVEGDVCGFQEET